MSLQPGAVWSELQDLKSKMSGGGGMDDAAAILKKRQMLQSALSMQGGPSVANQIFGSGTMGAGTKAM